jgi:ketosteroid isomerase-like protein
MPMRRRIPLALLAAATVAAAGCGHDASERFGLTTPPERPGAAPLAATPTPTQRRQPRPTQRDAERLRPLIAAWAEAVRKGDSERAANFFALPAIVAQSDTIQLATHEDAKAFNAGLPCGARLLEVQHDGRFIIGTFRLTERPGQVCQASGQLVRVAFVILQRHFTEWREIPDTPGAEPGPAQPEDPETLPRPGIEGSNAA